MATIAVAAPFKNSVPVRGRQKVEVSIVVKHGLTNRSNIKIETDITKLSHTIIYTSAISSLYPIPTYTLIASKPLIPTHLYRSTVAGTETEEAYGRTGQVYPTGFN